MSETPSQGGVVGDSGLLANDGVGGVKRTQEDLRLVQRAIRRGWGVPAEAKTRSVARMVEVVERRLQPADGDEYDASLAARVDANSVAAVRALAELDKMDQTDHWNEDKNARLDAGKATEIQAVQILTPQTRVRSLPPISPTSEPLPPADAPQIAS